MKTQQQFADQQARRIPMQALMQQELNAADKGRKHEAFEPGHSERRTLAYVLRQDRKR